MAYISQIKLSDTTYDISAYKLKNARTISLTGAVTGSGSFNGTANLALSTTIPNNSIMPIKLAVNDYGNLCSLNRHTAANYSFNVDTTEATGPVYTPKNMARDIFIGEEIPVMGGEKIEISFEISTNLKGNTTSGGTDSVFKGTTIGVYGYQLAGRNTSAGIAYADRVTATADAPWTKINSIVTVPTNARFIYMFLQTEGWGNWSGSVKLRNICVRFVTTASKLSTANVGSSGVPVYFSNGIPVSCSSTLNVNITGNAATATKATQDGSGNVITSKYVTLDTAQTISGAKTFTGRMILQNSADTDVATANSGILLIGNPTVEHISIDGNEIMAKATGTTAGTLNLQVNDGGPTLIGGTLTVGGATAINNTLQVSQTATFLNPIRIGNNANGDTNYIAFYGTTGDQPGSYNHAYIGENLWGSSESSELVLFKGNDPAATASTVSGAGPDRIRHIAAGHLFQVYPSALAGTFTEICDSTIPANKFEINQSGANVYGNLTVSGGINGKSSGAVSVAEIYDTTTQKKDILAYCNTDSNIHKLSNYGHSGEVNFARFFSQDEAASNYNLPCVDSHTHIYSIDNANSWIRLLSLDIRTNDIWTRSKTNGTWNNWIKLLDSSNYTNYTVTKTGGGASGTWGINITGNAATATTSSNSNWLNTNSTLQYGASGLNYFNISGTAGSAANANQTPTADWYHIIRMNHANSNGYYTDIASCFHNNNMYMKRVANGGSSGWLHIWVEGNSVTSAVWNDYAECRESDCEEFGYVLMEVGDDSLTKTTERLSHFAGVSSDTWGFSQGETARARTPIAVAGRVLVYPYQDRNNYKPGDCVCAAPGGTIDIMTREEVREWPDRIVGTVSCVPDYEEWGGGEGADRDPVKVNGRIWIKVK